MLLPAKEIGPEPYKQAETPLECRDALLAAKALPRLQEPEEGLAVEVCSAAQSFFLLGALYDHFGMSDRARRWWERAAEDGDVEAMVSLGRHHIDLKQPERAEPWLRQALEAGDRRPLLWIGQRYLLEAGEANVAWLRQALQGEPARKRELAGYVMEALFAQALMERPGKPTAVKRVLALFAESLDAVQAPCPSAVDDAAGQFVVMAPFEDIFAENAETYRALLRRLAEDLGCSAAQMTLGELYVKGGGKLVEHDMALGKAWYRKAYLSGGKWSDRAREELAKLSTE